MKFGPSVQCFKSKHSHFIYISYISDLDLWLDFKQPLCIFMNITQTFQKFAIRTILYGFDSLPKRPNLTILYGFDSLT